MKFDKNHLKNSAATVVTGIPAKRITSATLAVLTALASTQVGYATIDNTVTATGSSPGGTDDVTATASETVDVVDAITTLAVTKTNNAPANAPVGTLVTYTYTVENTGNVTLSNVNLSESHEGSGTAPTPLGETLTTGSNSTDTTANDGIWSSLAPGEIVTWTGQYTITQTDLNNQTDNDIDNTVTAAATAPGGVVDAITGTATDVVDMEDQNASLAVTKTADDDTDVIAGQLITYTYVVTNDGNVPITAVSLADNVTAGSGAAPTPALQSLTNTSGNSSDDGLDNIVDLLQPGDSATFTGTYTVTQSDVDNLQ